MPEDLAQRGASQPGAVRSEPCARCGGDADFDIASLWLCIDCYHIAGSTCAGIGRPVVAAAATTATSTATPSATPSAATGGGLGAVDQVC
jgi:hypothetical protein